MYLTLEDRNMKKVLITFLVLILVFCIAGCSAPAQNAGNKAGLNEYETKVYNALLKASDKFGPDLRLKSFSAFDPDSDYIVVIVQSKTANSNDYVLYLDDGRMAQSSVPTSLSSSTEDKYINATNINNALKGHWDLLGLG